MQVTKPNWTAMTSTMPAVPTRATSTERHRHRRAYDPPAAASIDTAIEGNASNASHVPNVLTANAAQSHPNCRLTPVSKGTYRSPVR
jgi:hypothetical protein